MNEIQSWINDPNRDYAAGVAIFARYGKNKALVRYFQTGTARFRMGKLVYEVGKLAKTAMVVKPNSQPSEPQPSTTGSSATARTQLPPYILSAKKEVATLYALIDKRHRELYDLGNSNADNVVRQRKKILDGRKPAIERADRLYRLKEDWFALEDGPVRERVASEIREMLVAPWEEQPTMAAPVETRSVASLQSEVSRMTDLQLSKRRTQLRSSITKAQDMLQYQTIRKGDSPTPMPPGPKRDEYERKLAVLKAELTAVCDELERRKPA